MPFVVESQLTAADWAAYQKLWTERLRARIGWAPRLAAVLLPLAAGALLVGFHLAKRDPTTLLAFAVGLVAMFWSIHWSARQFLRLAVPDPDGYILGSVRMEFSSDGIGVLRRCTSGLTQWSNVKEITLTDTHLFLWLDRLTAYIVPRRDLPEGDPQSFLEMVHGFAGPIPTTGAGRPAAPWTGISDSIHAPGFLSTLARRLAWSRVPIEGHGGGDATIIVCAAVALAIWFAFDRYAAGPGASLYWGGITDVAWYASGVVALAWLLHRASLGTTGFRPLLASLVAGLPLLVAIGASIRQWVPVRVRPAGYALLGFAAVVLVSRSLSAAGSKERLRALGAGSLFAFMFATVTNAVWVHPQLWFAHEDDDRTSEWADSERMLFAQPDRIDAAVARMADGRNHRPDVFFLGFAGVADEKVFAEELKLTERVVTERYQAVGRSLLLVNDQRDHDSWPIATVQGLRRALVKVAARMDRTEDVLFLMLTSHGSDKPSLSVSNGYWPLEQLDGRTLRAALDDAGIRWRVIVISACHSGAFIEPLSDPGTIVLTASAKDRTSFGCGDENEITYFGAALMRDALPQAESLASAFDRAKQLVAEREQQQKLPESKPQAYYGSAIRPYWQQVEAERRR